ncbi:MAG TPA: hypothetical protein PK495_03720 [Bacteroidales bacterium]|nr:hypothetical protein [Bacteroidales bacterium]
MKTKLNLSLMVLVLTTISCSKIERGNNTLTESLNNAGNVLFYTNAQMILNCGEFDVDIYIDNVLVGTLTRAFLPTGSVPSCNEVNSEEIVKIQKKEGSYSYVALINCSNYGKCEGEFIVSKDSCTKVFLDIYKCETLNKQK